MERRIRAEYIWVDGQRPTAKLRSKTRILDLSHKELTSPVGLSDIPAWGFDGSSTCQAETADSDCDLTPVFMVADPIRGGENVLVLCEVFFRGEPHPSNTRAHLRKVCASYAEHAPLFGIEQEYTLYDRDGVRPLRWPLGGGYPAPQGRYYGGVGCDEVYGRELIEAHTKACMDAGLAIDGTNAEVMPSQWEFQIGPLDPLAVSDQLWMARWLLYRLGENLGISAKLDPKPIVGDWNGAGAHANFSTAAMRISPKHSDEKGCWGLRAIYEACWQLERFHAAHVLPHIYGEDNDKRLTGRNETCDINTFRVGIGDRGASIRIPRNVYTRGYGYLEDRRPAANADPYRVCTALMETVCGNGFGPEVFSYFAQKE